MSNYCFGCGKDNPFGLHLHFSKTSTGVKASFSCEDRHMGWPGMLHGGITGALLDEASGYVPFSLGLLAVTAELRVTFVNPVRVGETLILEAWPVKQSRRLIEVEATLMREDGQMKARSQAKMVVLTKEQQESTGLDALDVTNFESSFEQL